MIDYRFLVDGKPPPFVIPFCASCDQGVEEFTVYTVAEPGFFVAEAKCHGKTSGIRMPIDEWEARQKAGEKMVMFQRREGFDSVR